METGKCPASCLLGLNKFLMRVLPCADFFSNFFEHVAYFSFCLAVSVLPKTAKSAQTKESKGLFELFGELYIHIFGKQMTTLTDASYST